MINCLFKTPLLLLGLFISTGTILGQNDSTSYGSIKFDLNVDEALLIHNNQFDEARIIKNGETISVKTGRTSIKLSIVQDYLFEEQFVLKKDSFVVISHEFELNPITKEVLQNNYAARYYLNANVLLITDNESEILLEDKKIGSSYSFHDAEIGNQAFKARLLNKNGNVIQTKKTTFLNSNHTFKIVENYIKPIKQRSKFLSVFPGSSQHYKHHDIKSIIIRTGMALTIASTSTYELLYRKNNREYERVLAQYQESTNMNEATTLGNELGQLNSKLQDNARMRNLSLLATISIYGYNILDGLFSKPKYGYREVKPIQFYLDRNESNNLTGTLSINF